MAIGDAANVLRRLNNNLAPFFGSNDPNIQAILQIYVTVGVFCYSQIEYVRQQTRIQTATGENLDLISQDYFGDEFPRRKSQTDTAYRKMLLALLLLERPTRKGLIEAITILTGIPPVPYEPWYVADCLAYDVPLWGYDVNGRYGDPDLIYTGLFDIYVPSGTLLAGWGGYDTNALYYDVARAGVYNFYGDNETSQDEVTDEDIYALINAFKAQGISVYVRIHRGQSPPIPSKQVFDAFGTMLTDAVGNPLLV